MKNFSVLQQIGFWIFFFGSVVVVTQSELTLSGAITRSLMIGIFYAINFYLCYLVLTPKYFEKKQYTPFFLYAILLQVLVGLGRYYVDANLLHQFSTFRLRSIDTPGKRILLIALTDVAVSSFSVMLRLSNSRLEYERKFLEKEKEQINTELQFLKSQIHPHFLFNTLNNLYTLILQKSDRASDALLRLSDLLRYLLYECEEEEVPLSKEVEVLRSFILLQQLKYAQPVNVVLDKKDIPDHLMIQPMMLIPLLENAFKYSDVGINDNAYIRIDFSLENGFLYFNITNSVDRSLVPAISEVGGIGIKNLRRRLELSKSESSHLLINDTPDHFDVELKVPV